MHFFHSFWKNLHLTENFYTDMSVVSVTNMRYAGSPRRATGEVNQDILVDKMVKNSFIDEHYQDRQQRKAKTFKKVKRSKET